MSTVKLDLIQMDAGTQPRVSIDEPTVADYAGGMDEGATYPPIVVFFDGSAHWLADGWHRVMAAKRVGKDELPADIRGGTKRDAILFSVGANASHGLRRSHEDKRKAVTTLLQDAEWCRWSDREIARACAVGHPLVAKIRAALTGINSSEKAGLTGINSSDNTREVRTKHGTTTTMDVSRIGKTAPVEADPAEDHGLSDEDMAAAMDEGANDALDTLRTSLEAAERQIKDLTALASANGQESAVTLQQRLVHAENRVQELMENARKHEQRAEFYMRQLARCGKAVGEKNLDAIAPAVEAMARARKVAA